jgi:Ala-tRNA(Pro) deacylase
MRVIADEVLSHDKEIAFNAGSHRELVQLAWADFERLVQPKIAKISSKGVQSEAA